MRGPPCSRGLRARSRGRRGGRGVPPSAFRRPGPRTRSRDRQPRPSSTEPGSEARLPGQNRPPQIGRRSNHTAPAAHRAPVAPPTTRDDALNPGRERIARLDQRKPRDLTVSCILCDSRHCLDPWRGWGNSSGAKLPSPGHLSEAAHPHRVGRKLGAAITGFTRPHLAKPGEVFGRNQPHFSESRNPPSGFSGLLSASRGRVAAQTPNSSATSWTRSGRRLSAWGVGAAAGGSGGMLSSLRSGASALGFS